jgi:hypothetical protein
VGGNQFGFALSGGAILEMRSAWRPSMSPAIPETLTKVGARLGVPHGGFMAGGIVVVGRLAAAARVSISEGRIT